MKMLRPKLSENSPVIFEDLGTTRLCWRLVEYRSPRAGEWYLSGASGHEMAYKAPFDYSCDGFSDYFVVEPTYESADIPMELGVCQSCGAKSLIISLAKKEKPEGGW